MPDPSRTDTTTMNRKGRRTVADKRGATAPRLTARTLSTEADVARRAYLIYLEEGCPQGRHLDHWLRAESELRPAA